MIKFLLFYSHKPHLYYKSKLVYSKEILSCNIKGILEYGVLPQPPFFFGGGGGGGKRMAGRKESGRRLQREYSGTSMCDHLL